MTPEAQRDLNKIQAALRHTAERDNNDLLSNSASALVVRLETVGSTFGMSLTDLTKLDQQLIRYALDEYRQLTQSQ